MSYHTVFNTTKGIYVCGDNGYGQLGLDDNDDRTVPTKLLFNHDVISIHCGSENLNKRKMLKSAATMI
jgi:alpha-tubulin suppressor-like RCC1 family protein